MIRKIFIVFLALAVAHCDSNSNQFEMTVDKVDLLQGFVLKGISMTGTVSTGCLANDDEYTVLRDGKEVLKTTARIVNVAGLEDSDTFDGNVYKGEVITLYIPDGKQEDVLQGDAVISKQVSCDKDASR